MRVTSVSVRMTSVLRVTSAVKPNANSLNTHTTQEEVSNEGRVKSQENDFSVNTHA